jgi:hypothetical protein
MIRFDHRFVDAIPEQLDCDDSLLNPRFPEGTIRAMGQEFRV